MRYVYSLGAKCVVRDPVVPQKALFKNSKQSAVQPKLIETSGIVAAGAIVASILNDGPMEFSVSSAKTKSPPALVEWSKVLIST